MSDIMLRIFFFSAFLYRNKLPRFARMFMYFNRLVFSIWLPPSVIIGSGCKFGKGGLGIVIHELTVIGDKCIISNNVTIGGFSKKEKGLLPKLGNCVRVGAGAVILGDVSIGDCVIIGANSVVTNDIPPNSICVGNPAKITKSNIRIEDYVDF